MKYDISKLLLDLKYNFKDINILNTALTHSSYVNEHNLKDGISNERLEFLGDAVLDLIIGEYFFLKYGDTSEGTLSKYRALVVDEESLYEVGLKLSIGDYMKFGRGEKKLGGKNKKSILADCLEAIIGAIFLDSGYEDTKRVVLDIFNSKLLEVGRQKLIKDYKSKLQEIFQKNNNYSIEYILYDEKGPDNGKTFYSKVLVDGEVLGRGKGSTKKTSEQMAAKDALIVLGEVNV
ncbi:ribonuclease-3 [Anaerosphaera aminiphila DSM 21120]|uniref:Ribonuclease 3 n=1 Tax=Anaerosphaera aminiphila DSM 21120 TaxID=1120995 RepID=A0A1M5RIB0_9FIRM|nr:ribonuclease III [Anaerosphaera aminiphila]SHH25533.1 ribonuclease-3 [Anaerosphaera aminiphila DSM 21120]